MAFSNIRKVPIGGGLALIVGDFTQTAGGGSQTYAVGSGRVLLAHFNPQASLEPVDVAKDIYSVSTSNAITTITLYGNSGVTAGTFVVLVDNGG